MFTDGQPAVSQPPSLHNLYQPSFSPPPPPASTTSNGSSAANNHNYPFSSAPNNNGYPAMSPAQFTLPPTTTLFTDHQTALAASAAPSAFYSSYGLYQPVVGPYPRFLTPSPEPSVLGDFELELELENMAAANAANGWDAGVEDVKGEEGGGPTDPFAGMTIAPSRPASPKHDGGGGFEANTLAHHPPRPPTLPGAYNMFGGGHQSIPDTQQQHHGQYESYGDGSYGAVGGEPSTSFEAPNEWAAKNGDASDGEGAGGTTNGTGMKGKGKGKATTGKAPRKPRGKKAAANAANGAQNAAEKAAASKKNRNPHATQLPGSSGQKGSEAGGEGHQGPVCTHCGSVTTPLWRRGPDDELLCNA